MNTGVDFDKICQALKSDDNILFALVFGSQAINRANLLSDVDIGIFTRDDIPLLQLGRIVSTLEKIAGKKVDLVLLNDLYKRKPGFAFRVVSSARLLFTRDEYVYVDFKKRVFLYYLDARPLLDMVESGLNRRIEAGLFGERNYAWIALTFSGA